MKRRSRISRPEYPSAVHPLQRYAAPRAAPEPDLSTRRRHSPTTIDEPDPSRYDDALYGQLDAGAQDLSTIRPMPDDPYAIRTIMTTAPRIRSRNAAAA